MTASLINNWFCKNFGDAMLVDESLAQLREQFMSLYQAADLSAQTAVFIRHETAEHLYCQVVLYFSPEASELAKLFDAESCAQPSGDDLGLLIGDDNVWTSLFSDYASDA